VVGRSNVLILGTDRPLPGTKAARTDTIILATFRPGRGYVGLLSIPRDLWLPLPDGRVNRINTAYYFAELEV
ncbi:MAG: LytR family transcriptional regulator, partial [Akkermansiaceae bacterium]|nr:LytR family transcriptional regulator [Akkermansiaceae bacterium]